MKPQEVTHFHLFGGSGSGAAGFKDADPTIGAIKGRMVRLATAQDLGCVATAEEGSAQ